MGFLILNVLDYSNYVLKYLPFSNQFKIYKSKKINSNKGINKNLIPRFEKLVEWLMKKLLSNF